MASRWPDRSHPWFPAFVVGVVVFAASLGGLGFALYSSVVDDDENTTTDVDPTPTLDPAAPTATPTPGPLTYSGALPEELSGAEIEPAPPGAPSDIAFVDGAAVLHIADQYFVPVAALGAAVDSLTSAQIRDLLSGASNDWSAVGGIEGPVVLAVAGPETDRMAATT